jgi:Ca2+-binding EF-hand superfamily protein
MVSGVGSTPGFSGVDFSAARQALFQKADANGSGGLSLEEFKSAGPKGANAPKGAPSVEEAFAQFDTDKSGELNQKELEAGAKQAFESRLQQGGLVSGNNVVQLNSNNFAQSIFDQSDSNGDGGLSLDEFKAGKPQGGPSGGPSDEDVFAQLDADGDGSVTSGELQEGLKKGPPGGFGGPGGPGVAQAVHRLVLMHLLFLVKASLINQLKQKPKRKRKKKSMTARIPIKMVSCQPPKKQMLISTAVLAKRFKPCWVHKNNWPLNISTVQKKAVASHGLFCCL